MNHDAADAPGFRKAHVGPIFSGVGGLVDPVPHHVAVANHPGFAGPGPHDTGLGRRHGERADRRCWLLIEDGIPMISAVSGFKDASGRGTGVIRARIAGNAGDRSDAIANAWAHEPKLRLCLLYFVGILLFLSPDRKTARHQRDTGKRGNPLIAEHEATSSNEFGSGSVCIFLIVTDSAPSR